MPEPSENSFAIAPEQLRAWQTGQLSNDPPPMTRAEFELTGVEPQALERAWRRLLDDIPVLSARVRAHPVTQVPVLDQQGRAGLELSGLGGAIVQREAALPWPGSSRTSDPALHRAQLRATEPGRLVLTLEVP